MKQDRALKKEISFFDNKVVNSLEQKLEKTRVVEIIDLDVSLFKNIVKIKPANDNLESDLISNNKSNVVPIRVNYVRRNINTNSEGKYGRESNGEISLNPYVLNKQDGKYVNLGHVGNDDEKKNPFLDSRAETLSETEAATKMQNLQYAHVLGNYQDVSLQERRKLAMWITFNPALFRLFEGQSLTREVDYSRYI